MGKFGSLVGSDKPFRTFLKLDGKQIVSKDDKPAYIDIYADDSAAGRRFDKEWRDHIQALAKDGKEMPTQEEQRIAKCAALTAGWYLVDPEKLEQIEEPCTRENALELYSLPMAAWIWVQPWIDAVNPGNFIKRSAKGSMSTQSGPSETTEG
ncbi:hypothetical protein ABIF26_006456 [Bradyrhizobium elkanii]|uniref:hypothetical protein n=1 Tax=Bradyrhizobium elkanii TaxID=29448 RepID=UPI0035174DB3